MGAKREKSFLMERRMRVMDLIIETLQGTAFDLTVSPFDTIQDVKARICKAEGIPVSQQHLVWNSQELNDECSLQEYDIQDGATLKLLPNMRVGPINTRRVALEDAYVRDYAAEYLNRDEILERLQSSARPLTVIIYNSGDQINFYRVVDRPSASSSLSNGSGCGCLDASEDPDDEKEVFDEEQQRTKEKMKELRAKMETLQIEKNKRRAPVGAPSIPVAAAPLHLGARLSSRGLLGPLGGGSASAGSLGMPRPVPIPSYIAPPPSHPMPHTTAGHESTALPTPISGVATLPPLDTSSHHTGCTLPHLTHGGSRITPLPPHAAPGPPSTASSGRIRLPRVPSSRWKRLLPPVEGVEGKREEKMEKQVSPPSAPLPRHSAADPIEALFNHARVKVDHDALVHRDTMQPSRTSSRSRYVRDSESRLLRLSARRDLLPPMNRHEGKKKSKRCGVCNKKTGLANSFTCRCGVNFCAVHRYAEIHGCSFDYKTEGRRLLEQNNPVITAPKLPKI